MVKHHAVPLFRRGQNLFVAVSDPLNLSALDEFKFAAGINTDAVLVDDEALRKLIATLVEKSGSFDTDMASLGADGEYDLEIGDGVVEEDEDARDAAVDTAVDSLSSLIEPIIMSVLGVLIGGLMIAMYLPIFMLGSVI